jgi:hypothetical protein
MFILFEWAACLILVAFVVTLLFAVCTLFIVLKEGATVVGRLARGIAHDARIPVARQTELIRKRLSAVGFGLDLNEHEEVNGSVLTQIGSLFGRLREGRWMT